MKKNINPEVFMNFYKLIAKISVLASLIAVCAHAGQNGNGGGGISRDGRFMTFYSAGFYTDVVDLVTEEVPQLSELINIIKTNPYLATSKKSALIGSLTPAPSRKYFKVSANSFTPEVRKRLLAEYGRVMNVNVNEVTLFAITDTESKNTYLFPEFFRLTSVEQKAILFHEAFWLVNPKATYEEVVIAEMSFQSYLENPNSSDQLLRWLVSMGNTGDLVIGSLAGDLKNGYLDGLVIDEEYKTLQALQGCNLSPKVSSEPPKKDRKDKAGKKNKKTDDKVSKEIANCEVSISAHSTKIIKLLDLFGENFFQCRMGGYLSECMTHIQTNLQDLTLVYPRSLFLKILLDKFMNNKVKMKDTYEINEGRDFFNLAFSQALSYSLDNQKTLNQLKNNNIYLEKVLAGGTSSIRLIASAVSWHDYKFDLFLVFE